MIYIALTAHVQRLGSSSRYVIHLDYVKEREFNDDNFSMLGRIDMEINNDGSIYTNERS